MYLSLSHSLALPHSLFSLQAASWWVCGISTPSYCHAQASCCPAHTSPHSREPVRILCNSLVSLSVCLPCTTVSRTHFRLLSLAGLVHTAPGHGFDDFVVCKDHGIAGVRPRALRKYCMWEHSHVLFFSFPLLYVCTHLLLSPLSPCLFQLSLPWMPWVASLRSVVCPHSQG